MYEVDVVDPKAPSHSSDFNVVQPLPGRPENMEQIADLYWKAALWITVSDKPNIRCEEFLSASPLKVVGRVC